MADLKISALTAATTPLAGTEEFPVVQGGVTKKTTPANVAGAGTYPGSFTNLGVVPNSNGVLEIGQYSSGYTWAILRPNDTASGIDIRCGDGTTVAQVKANYDFKVATGNLVIGTSGKGIDFSATAGTGTSELLDWYEEGAWTPSVGGTATYTTQLGSYTRIGNSVTVHFDLQIDNIGTGSLTTIFGLPFTVGSRTGCGSVGYFNGLSQSIDSLYIRADGATNEIICTALTTAASGVGGSTNLLTSASRIIGSLTYSV